MSEPVDHEDTKEENVVDEPEARLGRLSETGKHILGVGQPRAVIDQDFVDVKRQRYITAQACKTIDVSSTSMAGATGKTESHNKKPSLFLDLSKLDKAAFGQKVSNHYQTTTFDNQGHKMQKMQ